MASREQEEVLCGWIIRMTWSVFDGGIWSQSGEESRNQIKGSLSHFQYNFKGLKLRVLKST